MTEIVILEKQEKSLPSIYKIPQRSIIVRLTFMLVLTVILVSTAAFSAYYYFAYQRSKSKFESKAEEYIFLVSRGLEFPLWNLDIETIENIGAFFVKNENVINLKVNDIHGNIFLDIQKKSSGPLIFKEADIVFENRKIGHVRISLSPNVYNSLNQRLLMSGIFIIVIIVASLILTTGVLTKIYLRKPLGELSAIIDSYEKADYLFSKTVTPCIEFHPFVSILDQMGEKIQKQMKKLEETQGQYRETYYSAVEGIFRTTPDGKVIDANPAVAEILGFDSPEELIRSITHLATQCYANSDDRKRILGILNSEGKVSDMETQMQRKDGSLIWTSVSARTVYQNNGEVSHYEGFLVDITERKRVEQLTRETIVAKAHNKAKSRFLANMSHEIRTPMNAILGLCSLLNQTDLDDKQQDYIHKMEASGKVLLGIINDILDFSKIESGKLELESAPFNLHDIIDNLSSILAHKAFEKGLQFHTYVETRNAADFIGDALRLNQVLINLTTNAIKFTEKGKIELKAERINHAETTSTIRFSVKDTGIGIAKDEISNVFQSFTQAEHSTTRRFGGTGLGLSICKKIVEMMGGRIWVESEPGKGSNFFFTVKLKNRQSADTPIKTVPSEKNHSKDEIRRRLKGKRILLVEDNIINQQVATEILQTNGIIVDTAHNGFEAIHRIIKIKYDAILMDIQMPIMDGYEATMRIRSDPRFKTLPIIAMTANAMKDDRDRCFACGMNDYISKPINIRQLFSVLYDILATG